MDPMSWQFWPRFLKRVPYRDMSLLPQYSSHCLVPASLQLDNYDHDRWLRKAGDQSNSDSLYSWQDTYTVIALQTLQLLKQTACRYRFQTRREVSCAPNQRFRRRARLQEDANAWCNLFFLHAPLKHAVPRGSIIHTRGRYNRSSHNVRTCRWKYAGVQRFIETRIAYAGERGCIHHAYGYCNVMHHTR